MNQSPPILWFRYDRRLALGFLGWLAACFLAASLGAVFTPGDWYATLKKPGWNPPAWIFAPVWTTLYAMMAVAAWLVWKCGGFAARRGPLALFLTQLVLNAAWTPLFFGLHQPGFACADIVLLWLAIAATFAAFRPLNRAVAAELLNFPTRMTPHAVTSLRHVAILGLTGLAITMNTHGASERIVFDFQASTNSSAWQIVNDDVMGGLSTSSFRLANGIAVFQGKVSLENNGGFASARSLPARHDLAGGDTFVVRVRGDGRRYKFTAHTTPSFDSALYQCAFTTKKGESEEHRLPFKQFVATHRGRVLSNKPQLDASKVTSVGLLISDKQVGPFQLDIAWIRVTLPAGQ